jgi:hypothetical protein
MVRTIKLSAAIPGNRELHIKLPADIPTGPAEITVTVSSPFGSSVPTLGDLANSEFFGMWRDRVEDSEASQKRFDQKAGSGPSDAFP